MNGPFCGRWNRKTLDYKNVWYLVTMLYEKNCYMLNSNHKSIVQYIKLP